MPDTGAGPIYAVGDIHGRLDALRLVHDWIAADQLKNGAAPVVHVGDLVDRGPDSRGVIEHLLAGIGDGEEWIVLKGNHDRMFERFLSLEGEDPRLRAGLQWIHPVLGGMETLKSYGLQPQPDTDALAAEASEQVPETHLAFLRSLPLMYRHAGSLFVHAGIRPGVPLDAQEEDDLLWIRDDFHLSRADHGALIVHGHTPVEQVMHCGNRVNIDTGAAFGGPLSAIVIEDGEVFHIGRRGRKLIPAPQRR